MKQARYPLKVVERYGRSADTPLITVGTIHSVKGAEADVVIISPDLSQSGMQEYVGRPDTRDGVMRLFYVALTRAREGVVLCGQHGNGAVRWI
jgi:ATP-dependent exoDNAse (exonuclease V) beta subunit